MGLLETVSRQRVTGLWNAIGNLPSVASARNQLIEARKEYNELLHKMHHGPRELHDVQLQIDAIHLQMNHPQPMVDQRPMIANNLMDVQRRKEALDNEYNRVLSESQRSQAQVELVRQTAGETYQLVEKSLREVKARDQENVNTLYDHSKARLLNQMRSELSRI